MKLIKKLLPFAGALLGATPAAPLIPLINAVLPAGEDRLSGTTSVDDAVALIQRQPPDLQLKIDKIDLEREREHTEQIRILEEMNRHGSSTRPEIARGSFHVMAFVTIVIVSGITYEFATNGLESAEHMVTIGLGMASLMGPFTAVVWRYFGVRTDEKTLRLAVGTGHSPETVQKKGFLAGILGK